MLSPSPYTKSVSPNPFTLFDPTFNLSFRIADLPTGQLAVHEVWHSHSPNHQL
ncbi:hypothetical protein [Scytonema millei]|uniref:Uncharacterized protein n=2 Tax=Tolypothrix TaxID=111782 RepID=A0A8S9T6M9_9CYAN|nr:hypothetical protein DA73_0400023410 [Tolypothrix bouteillei VB521301]